MREVFFIFRKFEELTGPGRPHHQTPSPHPHLSLRKTV
nr:MAG TPA: hypothetical protein [Caudoviricetes sp.]DAW18824.1 MAG TPA: hypothetical protein [Bacteriophage sp.]